MITYKTRIHRYEIVPVIEDSFAKIKVTSSADALDGILRFYDTSCMVRESSYAMYLNRANNTTAVYEISKGGINGTIMDVTLIVKVAVEMLAKGVIVFHNHPSGNRLPSNGDKEITQKLKNGLSFLDIDLLDHIIIAPDIRNKWNMGKPDYFSFKDEGII